MCSVSLGEALFWACGVCRAVFRTVSDEGSGTGRVWNWDDAPLHAATRMLVEEY